MIRICVWLLFSSRNAYHISYNAVDTDLEVVASAQLSNAFLRVRAWTCVFVCGCVMYMHVCCRTLFAQRM